MRISASRLLQTAYTEARMDTKLRELQMDLESVGSRTHQDQSSQDLDEKLLLSQGSGQLIADYVDIPELAVEIQRAVWQVEKSLRAQQDLCEEKRDLKSANKTGS